MPRETIPLAGEELRMVRALFESVQAANLTMAQAADMRSEAKRALRRYVDEKYGPECNAEFTFGRDILVIERPAPQPFD